MALEVKKITPLDVKISDMKKNIKKALADLRQMVEKYAEKWGENSKLVRRCYYGFLKTSYDREQEAFLSGRKKYRDLLDKPEGGIALLRRNVHRLEKGILMRPRRVPFARDYIGETVDAFVNIVNAGASTDWKEMTWAFDVLERYFRIHDGITEVRHSWNCFSAIQSKFMRDATLAKQVPYHREVVSTASISIEQLEVLANHRRSVRWFKKDPVSRAAIERAIGVAAQSPSACNRLPYVFRVIDTPSLVKKVVSIPNGLAGYGHNVPVVAVVIGRQRNYFNERDRHLIYIDASLAVMSFIYALEVQGIGSCCVNWPDIVEKETEMAKVLKLDIDERPVMLIALGIPDPEGMVARSTKKSIAALLTYN